MVRRPRQTLVALLAAAGMSATACGEFSGIYDMPLPGGADLGDEPVEMTVEFRDVLDLVPHSAVQFNNVDVGRVEHIGLVDDGWHAEVTLLVDRDVDLPANPDANIKQSSLLGEKYVELAPPPEGGAEGTFGDGVHVPLARTNRNVEVEEVLGALSMLLNGGGVEQINTITRELNNAAFGNEAEINAFLRNSEEFARGLDGQTDEISDALDGLDRLSVTLNDQKELITEALDDLGPGLASLEAQRGDLVEMLNALDDLSDVAVETTLQSQEDLVANLESLQPILANLAAAEDDLPEALEILPTFPFADSAVDGIKGDYANLYVTINANIEEILETFGRERGNPLDGLPVAEDAPIGEDEVLDPSLVLPTPDAESDSPGPSSDDDTEGGAASGDSGDEPDGGEGDSGMLDLPLGGGR